MTLTKVSIVLSALGFFGLALHQAVNQRDLTAAAHSVALGLGVLGGAGAVHGIASKIDNL